jgi:hypothetical protein
MKVICCSKFRRFQRTAVAAIAVTGCIIAFSQTSNVNKKLLDRYPAADLNKDGVLSEQELLELKQWVRKNGGAAAQIGGTNAGTAAPRPTKDQKAARRQAKMRVVPSFTNVAYGPFERNRLDFWKAESAVPAPVLVLIHAGGFSGGDKSFWYSPPPAQLLPRARHLGGGDQLPTNQNGPLPGAHA